MWARCKSGDVGGEAEKGMKDLGSGSRLGGGTTTAGRTASDEKEWWSGGLVVR